MLPKSEIQRVCVYCSSSDQIDPRYHQAATALGKHLGNADVELIYGGGSRGSMGHVANGALDVGGRVTGILPRFMHDLEWGHDGLTELQLVDDMHERKHRMLVNADAVIALPGGCGTFEELFEAITFKQLGLFMGPIVLLNTLNYFSPLMALLSQCVEQNFMTPKHEEMWQVIGAPEQAMDAIANAPDWSRPLDKFPR
ncbi:MAG: TIGR00730 family Rossman fold protein [Lysobacterales bacterium]